MDFINRNSINLIFKKNANNYQHCFLIRLFKNMFIQIYISFLKIKEIIVQPHFYSLPQVKCKIKKKNDKEQLISKFVSIILLSHH